MAEQTIKWAAGEKYERTLSVGDLAFTVQDEPVVIEEFATFSDGSVAARVRYLNPDGSTSCVGIVSATDLMSSTHDEFEAAVKETDDRLDWFPAFRSGDTDLSTIPGVAYPYSRDVTAEFAAQ